MGPAELLPANGKWGEQNKGSFVSEKVLKIDLGV